MEQVLLLILPKSRPPDFAHPEMKWGAIQQLRGQEEEDGGSVESGSHDTG